MEEREKASCAAGRDKAYADMYFMSVKEAERALDGVSGAQGGGPYFRAVAAYVLDPQNNVYGTASEFFNFITSYLDAGDYFSAHALCGRALAIYPRNVDLLAVAIRSAAGCGLFDQCETYLVAAQQVPMEYWNWRLFGFTVDFFQAYLDACDPAMVSETLERGLEMAHNYQRYLPLDERGYDKEAELLLFANREAEAQRVLEHAVFGTIALENGECANLVAPQCCITMLDRVLASSTDYQLIAKVAQRGFRNTAQAQPSANIGYFVYREALALDAALCSAEDPREGFRNPERVREVLVTYRCAHQLLKDRRVYRATVERRFTVLCEKAGMGEMTLQD